jgi:hypothetical protein
MSQTRLIDISIVRVRRDEEIILEIIVNQFIKIPMCGKINFCTKHMKFKNILSFFNSW